MSVGSVEELAGQDWTALDRLASDVAEAHAASATRWAYAPWGAGWESLRPFKRERFGDKPVTRASSSPPDELREVDAYAYDADGELILARRYGARASEVESEHLWTTAADGAPVQLLRMPGAEGLRVVSVLR